MNLNELNKFAKGYDPSKYSPTLRENIEQSIVSSMGRVAAESRHTTIVRVVANYVFLAFTIVCGIIALLASVKKVEPDRWAFGLCWAVFVGGMSKIVWDSLRRR
jgi:hypothetical protein